MKRFYMFLCCIFIFNIVFSFSVFAQSNEYYGVEKILLTNKEVEKEKLHFSLKEVGKTHFNSYDNFMLSYDVNEQDECVVLFENATIVVLNSKGAVDKVFKFNYDVIFQENARSRDDLLIKWNDDNIEVIVLTYSLETAMTYCISSEGVVSDIWLFDSLSADIDSNNEISTSNYVYNLTNSSIANSVFGNGTYNKLERSDSKGNTETLFEIEKELSFNTKNLFIAVLMFTASQGLFAFVIIRSIKKSINNNAEKDRDNNIDAKTANETENCQKL